MSTKVIINQTTETSKAPFLKRGLHWMRVGWDDCSRAKNSSVGPNISDWSFQLKDGTTLPFLRGPNFADKTASMRAKDLAVVVGNEYRQLRMEVI